MGASQSIDYEQMLFDDEIFTKFLKDPFDQQDVDQKGALNSEQLISLIPQLVPPSVVLTLEKDISIEMAKRNNLLKVAQISKPPIQKQDMNQLSQTLVEVNQGLMSFPAFKEFMRNYLVRAVDNQKIERFISFKADPNSFNSFARGYFIALCQKDQNYLNKDQLTIMAKNFLTTSILNNKTPEVYAQEIMTQYNKSKDGKLSFLEFLPFIDAVLQQFIDQYQQDQRHQEIKISGDDALIDQMKQLGPLNIAPDVRVMALMTSKHHHHYVRVNNPYLIVEISDFTPQFFQDSHFKVKNKDGQLSFESYQNAGFFIKPVKNNEDPEIFYLTLAQDDGSKEFQKDIFFRQVKSLNGNSKDTSYESLAYPNQYLIHHKHFSGLKKNDQSKGFSTSASWRTLQPPIALQNNSNLLNTLNFQAQMLPPDDSKEFYKNSRFKIVNKLNGFISFESVNFSGYLLRSNQQQIILDTNNNSEEFNKDSTFKQVKGLSGNPLDVSFESSNQIGFFLKIENGYVFLRKNDSTPQFIKDASWQLI